MNNLIKDCQFITSAAKVSQLPVNTNPEVAFIGRSNAGKSSLINRLAGQNNLAKVSSKPGKTRLLNLFELRLLKDEIAQTVNLVDLPGYGYAKASKSIRANLAELVMNYFSEREQLKLVFLLSDCKRKLDETDVELRDFLFESGINVQVVLTKSDKLNQKDLNKSKKINSAMLGLEPGDLLMSSINKPVNRLVELMIDCLD